MIKGWFKRAPQYRVRIHMKSGNIVVLDRVTEFQHEANAEAITGLRIVQSPRRGEEALIVNTLVLSQIEAVTVEQR